MKTKLTLFVILLIAYVSSAQTIEKFSIDSGGASATAGGIQMLYAIGEVNVQEYSNPSLSVSEGFINGDFRIKVNPKTFLQGPLLFPSVAGQMNDTLRENALIPTTSPYADGATCAASVFTVTGANAIVDWVWVELRAANDNQKLINGRSALIQRDGDVVSVDGTTSLRMYAAPTNYYVVVKHRNHLGAMTSNVFGLTDSTTTLVDFTNSSLTTFGSNARVTLSSGARALWAGDANSNGEILFSGAGNDVNAIKDHILLDPANFLNLITFSSTGYYNKDIDLNGITRFFGAPNDSNFIKDNVLAHPGNFLNLPTYKISTTVPPTN